MQTDLQGAVAQPRLVSITGQRDITDDDWEAHLERLRSLGLDECTAPMSALYEGSW